MHRERLLTGAQLPTPVLRDVRELIGRPRRQPPPVPLRREKERAPFLPAVYFPRPDVSDHTFNVVLRVYDGGALYYEGEASTTTMRRSFDELAAYLLRYNVIADGTALLTGTGIVPPDEFALRAGHIVEIEVPGIGVLRNPVIQVGAGHTAGSRPDEARMRRDPRD